MPRPSQVQSEPTMKSCLVSVTISYRALSDTALVLCHESQLDEGFGPGEVATMQPDFDTHIEYRNIHIDENPLSPSLCVVGLQMIGARERRDAGFHEAKIPPRLIRLVSETIDSVPKDLGIHETWIQTFEVPVDDLFLQGTTQTEVVASRAEVKAVSAALDDLGVAHQSMMLRTAKLANEPITMLSREVRTLWSQLSDEVDQAQGLGPVTAVVRTLNALAVQKTLPISINQATQRSLVHILQGERWREVAETLREATWAINHIEHEPVNNH